MNQQKSTRFTPRAPRGRGFRLNPETTAALQSQSKAQAATATNASAQLGSLANMKWNLLPRRYNRILRYAETFSLTTGAGGVCGTEQVMSLNSLYDPNFTGVGHQPYGFDQLCPVFYNQYIVKAVKITLLANTIGGSAEVAVVYKLDTGSGGVVLAGNTLDRCTEAPMVGTAVISPSGNARAREILINAKNHKILGITPKQYFDNVTAHAGTGAASPSVQTFLRFAAASYSGAAAEGIAVQCIIDYDTEFFSPIQVAQS